MSHTALIRFAPLTTLQRVNDPVWKRPGRTMYDSGALTFHPGKTSAKLLVNHDDDHEIGVVHTLTRWEDTDGPWLAAIAEITDRPEWLERGTRASFGYGPIHTAPDVFGCEILRRGIVNEVSVLSPGREPAEPLACVLALHPTEAKPTSSPAAVPDRAAVGEIDDYRPPVWDELERIVGYRITDENFERAITQANRSAIEKEYDEFMTARQRLNPQVLIRPGIGQVLGVR